MTGLEVSGLTVAYGGLVANDDVSIRVDAGAVVGLIGPNGAGKSTFVDAITGFVAYRGSVVLDGVSLDGLGPDGRARAGLGRTWQSGDLFDDLSVRDNLRVGIRRTTLRSIALDAIRPSRRLDTAAADRAEALFGLAGVATTLPGQLSLGERKVLGVARAVAGAPKALLLDEPGAGLDAAERMQLQGRVKDLAGTGLAVLLIDHDVDLVLGLCDTVTVLDFGKVIASGSPEKIREDRSVIDAYLGEIAS